MAGWMDGNCGVTNDNSKTTSGGGGQLLAVGGRWFVGNWKLRTGKKDWKKMGVGVGGRRMAKAKADGMTKCCY